MDRKQIIDMVMESLREVGDGLNPEDFMAQHNASPEELVDYYHVLKQRPDLYSGQVVRAKKDAYYKDWVGIVWEVWQEPKIMTQEELSEHESNDAYAITNGIVMYCMKGGNMPPIFKAVNLHEFEAVTPEGAN